MFSSHRGELLALVCGAVYVLAFAPFGLYPLSIVSLACLFALCRHVTPRRAILRGYLFGFALFGCGASWVYVSIHDFGHIGVALSAFLTVLFIIVLSLFPALATYVANRIVATEYSSQHLADISFVLIYPSVWTLFEWIRGWFLTGFPWLNLGYSQIDSPLSGLAPVLGVYGVSLFSAISSAMLVATFKKTAGYTVAELKGGYLVLLLALWGITVAISYIDWTYPAGNGVKVSMIQGNIPQDLKWAPAMREPTLRLYAGHTRDNWDSDLIIWPETALSDYYYRAVPFIQAMAVEAQMNNTDILLGVVYQKEFDSAHYYNSMISLPGDKQREMGVYHKDHLVPFTEYLPLKSVLGGLIDILDLPMSDFTAGGAEQLPLELAGQPVGISICYEDAFGEEVIRRLPEATMLINVSNDAWFGESIAPHQHLQIARMRALETGRVLMRATNTGVSAVINPKGKLQAVAPQFREFVLTEQVQPMKGATPYVLGGNISVIIIIALMIVFGLRSVKINSSNA